MPPIIRRRPLWERITSYLNPLDLLLTIGVDLDSNDWDSIQHSIAGPAGILVNLWFLIARANASSAKSGGGGGDGVFADDPQAGRSFWGWFTSFSVLALAGLSLVNAFYTFFRRRHYRLFEKNVELPPPSTPSARRVRVDSAPVSSSPLRFLGSIVQPLLSSSEDAQSRSYPDSSRDVWEITVWDPLPINLRLFCYFSPGHVLVYWLFLPAAIDDPRPSLTVLTAIFVGILLTTQLMLLQQFFSQQSKDSAVIQREVLSEYDSKFVRPHLYPAMRDVATQYSAYSQYGEGGVEVYNPTSNRKIGYTSNPNLNYAKHFDPEGVLEQRRASSGSFTSGTTIAGRRDSSSSFVAQTPTPNYLTPLSETSPHKKVAAVGRTGNYRSSLGATPSATPQRGDGGSLGVYSSSTSPLKKASSAYFTGDRLDNRSMAALEQRGTSGGSGSGSGTTGYGLLSPAKRNVNKSEFGTRRRESGRF